jgi:hypothetical protein
MWGERVFALHPSWTKSRIRLIRAAICAVKETNKMNDFAFAILLLVLAISLHLTIGRRT